jgi:chemotaxis protein CheD
VRQIIVGMADCRVGADPGQVLVTYALGSCIGLTLYDPVATVGGMLHYMLPDSTIDSARARENPCMFADTGVPLLLEQVIGRGASKRRLIAHAVGGAQIMDQERVFEIGKRNYLALRRVLWKAGLLLQGEAVGGMNSRTLRLDVGSGRLWFHEAGTERELCVPRLTKGASPWRTEC